MSTDSEKMQAVDAGLLANELDFSTTVQIEITSLNGYVRENITTRRLFSTVLKARLVEVLRDYAEEFGE